MTFLPQEELAVSSTLRCAQCGRKIEEKRKLDGESLRTGNTTQQAVYHLNEMSAHVMADAQKRGWTMCVDPRKGRESAPVLSCAHCAAASTDPLEHQ